MNSQISTPRVSTLQPAEASAEFSQQLSCTRRGARLARTLTTQQLHDWGIPHGSELSDTAAHVVAELAANAVTHGYVPGCDTLLRLVLLRESSLLRIEVTDARNDRRPEMPQPDADGESGRGLRIVAALASDWGVTERALGKTVWAELPLP